MTSIQLKNYSLALIGILPGTVLYVFIGATAGSLTESENAVSGPWAIAAIVIGIIFGLLAVFAASYYAKREFNKIVAVAEQEEQEQEGFAAENQPEEEGDEMA